MGHGMPQRLRVFLDLVAQMADLEPAWPAVVAHHDDDPAALTLVAVDTVFDGLDRTRPIEDLIPALRALAEDAETPAALMELLPGEFGLAWRSLARRSLDELLAMPSVGRRRAMRLLAAATLTAVHHDPSTTVSRAVQVIAARVALDWPSASVLDALEAMSVDDPVLSDARQLLGGIPAVTFLTAELRPAVDPHIAAATFRACLDDRQRLVLDERMATIAQPSTLQVVADELSITRERVRQIQQSVEAQLEAWRRSEAAGPVRAAAARLAARLGVLQRLDVIAEDSPGIDLASLPPELELIVFLAGPYRRDGGWLVRRDFVGWREQVEAAVERALGDRRAAPVEQCIASVETLDIHPALSVDVIVDGGSFRHVGDSIVDWRGNLADRAVGVLVAEQRPLTVDEISERMGAAAKVRSIRAAIGTDARFVRCGGEGWGLRTWEGPLHDHAFDAVLDALDRGDAEDAHLEALTAEVAARYGFDAPMLAAIARSSPLLIVEGDTVRRRRPSEPYRSALFLKDTRGVFSVEGAWSYRLVVDERLRSGDSTVIPDSFATYLGMQPGTTGSLTGPVRPVPLSWTSHEPRIGSVRREAAAAGAHDGDLMFVRRTSLTTLDFLLIPRTEFDVEDPAVRLAALVGAPGHHFDPVTSVGNALGLGGAVAYSVTDLIHRLTERGDEDVLEALQAVLDRDAQHRPDRVAPPDGGASNRRFVNP